MKIKRIYACWIYVSDLQRSQEFYRNIGFDIKVVDGDWIEFALGETSFAILKRPESKGEVVASKTRIMFEVEQKCEDHRQHQRRAIRQVADF